MARRSNLEGSVYRRSDGRWVGSVRLGTRRLYRYGLTKLQASQKLQELIRQHHAGQTRGPCLVTVGEWVTSWLDGLRLRPSTIQTYRRTLMPVVKEIGDERLDRLTPSTVSLAYSRLAKRGMGSRRLHLSHGYFKACLNRAVDLEMVARNPMEKLRPPRHTAARREFWSIHQAGRFLDACSRSTLVWAPLLSFLTT
jgi:integrase